MFDVIIAAALFTNCPGYSLPDPCATPDVSCADPANEQCAKDCQDAHGAAIEAAQAKHRELWCKCNGSAPCEIQRDAQYLVKCLEADGDLAACVVGCGCSIVVSSSASVDATLDLLANFGG